MRYLLALVFALMTSAAHADWTPPAHPDPSGILNEAKKDAREGRYADALAKHLWFHQNALQLNESFYGVRLSFALGYWAELGRHYLPAMEALLTTRDSTAARILAGQGGREDFHDVSSINEYLRQQEKTTELFLQLDANNPKLAKQVYRFAEPALIRSRLYQVCGKYLDQKSATKRMISLYQEHQRLEKRFFSHEGMRDFPQRTLSHSAETLVALLTLNGRMAEADKVIAEVLGAWPDENFRKSLAEARKGVLPRPWPSLDD